MNNETKTISILLVVHDQAALLEQNLPLFLDTAKEAGAQVVVIDDMSTDSTPDVLQRLRNDYDNLYTTFLPKSVIKNPSRRRLALSVGVKAAKGNYIVMADIHRPPLSVEWLTELSDGEAALVYTNRKGEQTTHVVASQLEDLKSTIIKAERKNERGHCGHWLKQHRGLYDAFAVKKSRAFDAISYVDQPVSGWQLLGLRLKVWL